MRFTESQYDHAIEALTEAKKQLEPDGERIWSPARVREAYGDVNGRIAC